MLLYSFRVLWVVAIVFLELLNFRILFLMILRFFVGCCQGVTVFAKDFTIKDF